MKLGLALSGGGVKGAAHIGVIKALEENEIQIHAIAGTSSGSIVATLYGMGYTSEEMLKLFNYFSKGILRGSPMYRSPDGKSDLSIKIGGILSGQSISDALEEAAKLKEMEMISQINKIQIAIPTVDILNGEKYVFTNSPKQEQYYIKEAKISTAVRASSSYPGVFAPCLFKEHKFVDGGVLDNVPADEVKKLDVDKVIAIKFALDKKLKPNGIYGVAMKSMDIIFDNRSRHEVECSDLVLDVDTKDANVFNIKKINDCYRYGYETAILHMIEIKKMLK
ncbi:MAG: patatin-like phospholipase family protein [Clostridia bacterium]